MADEPDLLTAAQLDAMTPNERMAAFEERIITDLDQLPADFRDRVITTADRLHRERNSTSGT